MKKWTNLINKDKAQRPYWMPKKAIYLLAAVFTFVCIITGCGLLQSGEEAQPYVPDDEEITSDIDMDSDDYEEDLPNPWESTPHGEIAIQYITHMDTHLYRRPGFTYRELDTAMWIQDTLLDMGFSQQDIEVQSFAPADIEERFGAPYEYFFEQHSAMYAFADRQYRDYSQNVILTIPGESDQVIVVGAHYDTLGSENESGNGASNNASGVGLLLESAQRMRYLDHYYTLVYVFFGAEEMYQLGSYHYVNTLSSSEQDNILFMTNADVLFDGSYLIYIAGAYEDYRRVDNELTRTWDNLAQDLSAEHDIELIPYPEGMDRLITDHIVFYEAGITVLYFGGLDRTEEGVFATRIHHTLEDNLDYIMSRWPDKVEHNMWAFSIFLEEVLLYSY